MTLALLFAAATAAPVPVALPPDPQVVATVDARYQSYNVEMVEVTGGRFWKPYRLGPPKDQADRYAYRPPLDLANPRLRKLAAALGPVYVRVSGTWASATYIAPKDGMAAPPGFTTVLTPSQWRGLAAFVKAVDGELVLSAPTSPGTRDANGVWQPEQLEALLRATQKLGVPIAGVAFMNEPNLIGGTGAPKGYSAADYGRDYARFVATMRRVAPGVAVLGPGSVGGPSIDALATGAGQPYLKISDVSAATRPPPDTYTYHHYGAVSQRCATSGPIATKIEDARDPAFLARSEDSLRFHAALRDRDAPGARLWVTETAQAACGGSPGAATFVDTARYVDQLGRLARGGVSAVFHNTLAASDYALLDERDFAPRPNYWAALLWARLMGTRVLDMPSPSPTLRTYAHCLKAAPGGVALVAINLTNSRTTMTFSGRGSAYALAGVNGDKDVSLNGTLLRLGTGDAIPRGLGVAADGSAPVAPNGVTFVRLPDAGVAACR